MTTPAGLTVGCSVAATVLLEAPVGMHRLLFRRHRTQFIVSAAQRFAYSGLLLMGLALTGVTVSIFGAVVLPLWVRHGEPPSAA